MTTNLDPLTTSDYPWIIPFFGRTKLVNQRFQNVCWPPDCRGGRTQINLVRTSGRVWSSKGGAGMKQFSTSWSVGFGLDANGRPYATVTELGPTGNPFDDAMMFTITDRDPNYKGTARLDRSVPHRWQWPMWKSLHERKYTSGYWSDLIGEDSGMNPKIYSGRNQFVVDPFVIEWIRQLFCAFPGGAGAR